MDQKILDTSQGEAVEPPPSSGVLRWVLIAIVIAVVTGGGYWYYQRYIISGKLEATPTPEITEAIWKTKSEKTVNGFLDYWSQSSDTTEGLQSAKKAKDLLTIALQAKLETLKDDNGQLIQGLPNQLDKLLGVSSRTGDFKIFSSQKIDERNVDVKVNLSYNANNGAKDKVFRVILENNIWLIDTIQDYLASPSPTTSVATTPTVSASPGAKPSPTISPSASL